MFDFEFFRSRFLLLLAGLLGFILMFVVLGFLFYSRQPSAYQLKWQSASQVLNQPFLVQIIQENSSVKSGQLSLDSKDVKVLAIPSEKGKLYVVDFNTPKMCGKGGCLYVVYTSAKEKILELLLIPRLPMGKELFTLLDRKRNGIPCLSVAQFDSSSQFNTLGELTQTEFCYEGIRFVKVNQVYSEQ